MQASENRHRAPRARPGPEVATAPPDRRTWPTLLLGLGALVASADLLFLGRPPGLSLAAFALAVALAVRVACGPARPLRRDAAWGAILIWGVLPSIEQVHPLSLLFWIAGLVGAAVAIGLGPRLAPAALALGAARFLARAPVEPVEGLRAGLRWLTSDGRGAPAGRLLARWLLPAGAGLVLAFLLLAANPVLSLWAERLARLPFDGDAAARHGAVWVVTAILVWPFLALGLDRAWLGAPRRAGPAQGLLPRPAWVNEVSIRNALVLVNAVLGVQTLLDLGYLWGGADLPEGVTYAQYAHRGAYPLVATALLAGGFALLSRPFAAGRPGLRALLGLWLGQNVLLVLSSLLRLGLYVEAFGLTWLRLAAVVWMGLVGGGLVLTAWQAWRDRSNGWLLGRVAVMAGAVLWMCCFVNGADLIARTNIARFERTGILDRAYLCGLGPGAGPAIRAFEARHVPLCEPLEHRHLLAPVPRDWRDWGFRSWRLRRYAGQEEGS